MSFLGTDPLKAQVAMYKTQLSARRVKTIFAWCTGRVDVLPKWNKAKTINAELRLALGALAGMMTAGRIRCVGLFGAQIIAY